MCTRNVYQDRSCTVEQISVHYKRLYRSLFLKVEIIIFKSRSDHYFFKVEISNFKISRKTLNFLKLSNTLLNNPWIKIEIILDIRKYSELNDNENITSKYAESS